MPGIDRANDLAIFRIDNRNLLARYALENSLRGGQIYGGNGIRNVSQRADLAAILGV